MATPDAFTGKSLAETFPAELLSIICQYLIVDRLPKDDLANFRSTSKNCAAAATPYLFQSQHVSLILKSLQNLQNISEQPHLAKHVREIWYEPRLMESMYRSRYNDLVPPTVTPEEIKRGWTIYCDWFCQQKYLVKMHYLSAVLAKIFPRLTNLREIAIQVGGPMSYIFVRMAQQVWLDGEALISNTVAQHESMIGSKCLEAILHACSLADTKLTSLKCDSVGETFFMIRPEFMPSSVFQHLRDLDIVIYDAAYTQTSDTCSQGLNRVLRSAVHLVTLRIIIDAAGEYAGRTIRRMVYRPGPFWDNAMSEVVLPKLESLKLFNISGGRDRFIEFFTKHAASLNHLSLDNLQLMEDVREWYRVFHTIMTVLNCSVEINGTWEGKWADEQDHTQTIPMTCPMEGNMICVVLEEYLEGCCITADEHPTVEGLWDQIIATCLERDRQMRETRNYDDSGDPEDHSYPTNMYGAPGRVTPMGDPIVIPEYEYDLEDEEVGVFEDEDDADGTVDTNYPMATLTETPGRSILDVLPTEIIVMICGLLREGDFPPDSLSKKYIPEAKALPRDALCNFRLASKDCAAAATSYLFRHLHILYTKRSFQNLLDISKSAHLAKHVRSICYEPRILHAGFDKYEYTDYYETAMEGIEQPISSDIRMEQGWDAYKKMVNEQHFIRKTAWDAAIFTLSIPRFTCLDAITIDTKCVPSYRALQSMPPPFDRDASLHESPCDPMIMAKVRKPTNAILVATALANVNLVTLRICLVPEELLSSLYGTKNVILPFFKHIRHLSLNLGPFPPPHGHGTMKGLIDLLRFAPGLESLSIKFAISSRFEPPIVWDKGIEGLVFPSLQKLELSSLPCRPSSFMNFFKRHAATLKHIVLESMCLVPDPMYWHDILEVLKNDLSLESAAFRGVWEGFSEKVRVRYLIRMDKNIHGCPVSEYLEDCVLKRAPALMQQFSSIDGLWRAIVEGRLHQRTATTEASEDGESEDEDD
ncbi:F-box domain cyclin protein [Rutstroemia sp. NJR-2017a BVV2]|nr:F-box domain cyclin protein [Rutstroemia sp. NJR-2017a BVV2]